ncbi:zinc finger MYM-type protein 1-like [Olea europaea var. sylvestris]|uniref:zinc finger MYM-type protein 1-like n=1 Tax=Olea europaea var. sylvestris TaxID=158386 RepID=UPI000C1D6CA6|nr:zinc finger MYM-type protein 1-like [Olea europaea var. sylvestris]
MCVCVCVYSSSSFIITIFEKFYCLTTKSVFQKNWFTEFPWLEYSPSTERAYCFYCFLFLKEAQDASNREQMTIILRFVNSHSSLIERFFAIKRVSDITSSNLKNEICDVLAQYELRLNKMRVQGYDGTSNMRGAWNGFQALFLRDCPYAYYVRCFAHQLQRVTELQSSHREGIQHMLATAEREFGSGANQIVTLQQSRATRWSSHDNSIKSMIDTIMRINNVFCQALQRISQDIFAAFENNITIPNLEERELDEKIDPDSIIDEYYVSNPHWERLK